MFAVLLSSLSFAQSFPPEARPVIRFDPTSVDFNEEAGYDGATYGWDFLLVDPVVVMKFGWFDQDADGLSHAHEVGLWLDTTESSQTNHSPWVSSVLITSATVQGGTNAALEGVWRTVTLDTPIRLAPGHYMIGGLHYTNNPDVVKFILGRVNQDPRFVHGSNYFTDPMIRAPTPGVLQLPNDSYVVGTSLELGPNLFALPPEPWISLLGDGGIQLGWSDTAPGGYTIYESDRVRGGVWSRLAVIPPGSGDWMGQKIDLKPGVRTRFFRVEPVDVDAP